MIPFEFRNELWCQKTRVKGLSFGVICVILRLAVLIQYRSVTDTHTQTDKQTDTRRRHIPRLARRRAVKITILYAAAQTAAKLITIFVIPIHVTTYAESMVKIGPVVAEIFCGICRLVQKGAVVSYPRNLWGYWTDLNHICTRCSYSIATKYFWIASLPSECHFANFAQIWLPSKKEVQIGYLKYLSFGEKITKIGPVDPEITWVLAIIKKEINASKICSPSGKFVKWAI